MNDKGAGTARYHVKSSRRLRSQRKIRKDVKIQVNDGKVYESAVLFLGDGFVRITEQQEKEAINTYYSWDKIGSIRTFGKTE